MILTIHTDGGSRGNPGLAGCGVAVFNQEGIVLAELQKFLGTQTNNEAEYAGLKLAFQWLLKSTTFQEFTIEQVIFKLDSKLVVEQIQKHWKIKEPRLHKLAQEIWQLQTSLPYPMKFLAVPRAENQAADRLANMAMDQGTMTATNQ